MKKATKKKAAPKKNKRFDVTKHPLWPKDLRHPMTNEPFVRGEIKTETDVQEIRFGPPTPPSKSLYEDDDDGGLIYVRERTHEEMVEATAAYNDALKEYSKTNGLIRMAGRTETTGSFYTRKNDWADGVHDGGKWILTRYGT